MEEGCHISKLWVLSVPELVFHEDNRISLQSEFEGMFRSFDDYVQFQYYNCFGRVLISYSDVETTAIAFEHLQGTVFHGLPMILSHVKPFSLGSSTLGPPTKTHNYLISPPPSPPLGWEPIEEAPPIIDYNLIAAMTRLRLPGETQPVYQGNGCLPSIVVSCIDEDNLTHTNNNNSTSSLPSSIVQTSRPPFTQ